MFVVAEDESRHRGHGDATSHDIVAEAAVDLYQDENEYNASDRDLDNSTWIHKPNLQ